MGKILIYLTFWMLALTTTTARALDLSLPDLNDPWDTASVTAPDAATPWQGDIKLPDISESAVDLLAGLADKPLTLIELTELALRNNPQTRFAWAAARANAAGIGIAKADYFPQLEALLSATQSRSASSSGTPIPLQNRYGSSISLSYLLLDFGAREAQLDAARYNLLAANLNHNQVIQNVILQVEQSYYLLLGLQALAGANELNLKNTKANLDAANARRKSGLATVGDVYQAETAVAQAQLALSVTRGDIANVQGQLANAVGTPVARPLLLEPLSAAIANESVTQDVEQLIEQAKVGRPELIAAQAQVGAAEASVKLSSSLGKPTLSLTGGAFLTEIVDQATVDGYNVGLTLRIPLFTGFRNTYATRQSRALLEQTRAGRDDVRNRVELQVWQAFYSQRTASATITTAVTLLRSATQAAEVAAARYKAGVGTILEVLSTQAAEADARVQNIQAQLNRYVALAQLGHAIGALQPGER